MNPRQASRNWRQGTLLIIVGVILLLIFLTGLWFSRFHLSLRGQTHRQGEQRLTGSFAHALCLLAAHKMHFGLLHPGSGGKLLNAILVPLNQLADFPETSLDLDSGTPNFGPILDNLKKPLSDQGPISFEVSYFFQKADFKPLGAAVFPREKAGYIRFRIKVSFRKLVEEFSFACPVKVCAGVVPGLSKFTLFLDDTTEGGVGAKGNPYRLNFVSADVNGNLKPGSPAKPIVLNHGITLSPADLKYPNFFSQGVGLVYLGGPDMALNLARGESRSGDFGEGFQFYEMKIDGDWDGLYVTEMRTNPQYGRIAFLQWDKGVTGDISGADAGEWWSFVASTPYADFMKSSSVFRLYGTDQSQSPTLVLGKVHRGQITAKAFKTANGTLPEAFFYYVRQLDVWQDYIHPDPCLAGNHGLESICLIARDVLGLDESQQSLEKYREKYSSGISQGPYNRGLGFIATNNRNADPASSIDIELRKYVEVDRNNPFLDAIPKELAPVCGGATGKIPPLSRFLQGLEVPGARTIWEIDLGSGSPNLIKGLETKGLVRDDGSLDLRGWVLVKSPSGGLTVDAPLRISSPGGIVLEKGSITITKEIEAGKDGEGNPIPFGLVAMAGDITVQVPGKPLEASLVASGRVKVAKGQSLSPSIHGNLVGGSMDWSTASEGAMIKYNPGLSLLPGFQDREKAFGVTLDPNMLVLR